MNSWTEQSTTEVNNTKLDIWHIDVQLNGAGEMLLENFVVMDRSVTSTKLFISAYRQIKTEGVGMLAFSCFIGISINLCITVIYLYINRRSLTTAWISGMSVFGAAGACLLAIKIPDGYSWHSTAVEAILDLFTCLDVGLVVINRIKERTSNENLLRDFAMVSGETLINMYLFADYLGKTHSPWNAAKILHLFGSCLTVLTGVCQFAWILYKYKAYTHQVSAGGEEQPTGAAVDGDVEQQMAEQVAEVVEQGDRKTIWSPAAVPLFSRLVERGRKKSRVLARETEMSTRAATEDDEGGRQGEEVSPEEETSPVRCVQCTDGHRCSRSTCFGVSIMRCTYTGFGNVTVPLPVRCVCEPFVPTNKCCDVSGDLEPCL